MSNLRVVHPANLFVEHVNLLKDPDNEFVKSFQNFMNITIETKSEVLFTNYLSVAFWTHPPGSDLNSGSLDAQTKSSLRNQIYPFFTRYINENNDTSKLDPSDSDPNLTFFDEKSIEETKKLITSTEKYQSSFFLSTDEENYKFSLNGEKLKIKSITSANELYEQVDSFEKWWPRSKKDIQKFEDCLNVYWKKNGVKPIYKYKFSENFLADFLKTKNFKDEIIDKVGLKLSISLQNASKYPLKDEDIGKGKERRFRVTQKPTQTRIHYFYDNNEIIFERFYDVGQHDVGLRKK